MARASCRCTTQPQKADGPPARMFTPRDFEVPQGLWALVRVSERWENVPFDRPWRICLRRSRVSVTHDELVTDTRWRRGQIRTLPLLVRGEEHYALAPCFSNSSGLR